MATGKLSPARPLRRHGGSAGSLPGPAQGQELRQATGEAGLKLRRCTGPARASTIWASTTCTTLWRCAAACSSWSRARIWTRTALDRQSWHLLGRDDAGVLQAYLRIVDPGVKYAEPSIGRVITAPETRGTGLGARLMSRRRGPLRDAWPGAASASVRRRIWSASTTAWDSSASATIYLEDNIPHLRDDMEAVMQRVTHEVFNQASRWSTSTCSMPTGPCATRWRCTRPGCDTRALSPGREAGSGRHADPRAPGQRAHAGAAHHDRFGRRIDQVEFHPSYHALMAARCATGLHGTPWARQAPGGAHRARRGLHALHRAGALGALPGLHDLCRDAGAARATRRCTPTGAPSSPATPTTRASCPWRRRPA